MPNPEFHQRLRDGRIASGLSQSELAAKVGVQPPVISHFENGKRSPSIISLRKLADALGLSVDYLLGRTADPSGNSMEPVGDTTVARVYRTLHDLQENEKQDVLNYAQYKVSQKRKEDP